MTALSWLRRRGPLSAGDAEALFRKRAVRVQRESSDGASSGGGGGLALLALSGAAAQASQAHPWGARLSSPLVAMLLGGLAAAAFPGALSSAGLFSAVSGTLVPLAACLALLEIEDGGSDGNPEGAGSPPAEGKEDGDVVGIGRAGSPPAEGKEDRDDVGVGGADPTLAVSVAFALASLATVAATLVAVFLCVRAAPPPLSIFSFLLPSEALLPRPLLVKVAACLCASYVGGSVNFAATAAALGLGSTARGARAMAAAFAADLVAMAVYFGALAALQVSKEEEEWARGGGDDSLSSSSSSSSYSSSSPSITTLSAALSLAAASCSVALGEATASALGCPQAALAIAALFASAFGLAGRGARRWRRKKTSPSPLSPPPPPLFAGASAASSSLMLLFFASCGAQTGSPSSLRAAASLGGFVALLLALQLAATLALGRGIVAGGGGGLLRNLPMPALVVGANAAVGGPGTAAAAAQARFWGRLVRPAVLAGSAGYAIGTGVGVGVAAVLSRAFL